MAPDICRLMSKGYMVQNYFDLNPPGKPRWGQQEVVSGTRVPEGGYTGLDQRDDPPEEIVNERKSCLDGVGAFIRLMQRGERFAEARQAKIGAVKVKGKRATVAVTFPGGKATVIRLINESGQWKFEELGGSRIAEGSRSTPAQAP